ncbi:5'-nucleotidase SurE [Spirochaetia bacterium]|nr:5'-nucleotidase SurE [Spirochaetia bacterium]
MNILLTNDDGITGEGFLDLAAALRQRTSHTVYVLAPDTNRSGVSNALTLHSDEIEVLPYSEGAWSCPGTPADCVRLAVMGALPAKPDLVVAGINAGSNIGTDLIYSGTAAAARQGALCGIPSIAFSLVSSPEPFFWDMAIDYAVTHLAELAALWMKDTFLNVNLPNIAGGPLGFRLTWPTLREYEDVMNARTEADGRIVCSLGIGKVTTLKEAGSDWEAVSEHYASVSPVFLHPVVLRDICTGAPSHAGVGSRPRE